MIDDKKRKPSRDFPAHAQVPAGKHDSSKARFERQSTAPAAPPSRMHDLFHILHPTPRPTSLSTDSRISLPAIDGSFDLRPSDMLDADADDMDASLSLRANGVSNGTNLSTTSNGSSGTSGSASLGPNPVNDNGLEPIVNVNIPKNERPPQPTDEREYFERLWAENFQRSEAQVSNTSAYIPVGVAGRLNRIQGFSFAQEEMTHRLYAVYRLEIECLANEKQWTIYRRFHDFKQLWHQLKTNGMRISPLPTKTRFMRYLDPAFLNKRQGELDRWLREVLMVVSLEHCNIDRDEGDECGCGDKGVHASCRTIRDFLTRSANQPPVFKSTADVRPDPMATSASLSLSGSSSSVDMLSASMHENDSMLATTTNTTETSEDDAVMRESGASTGSHERRSIVVQNVDDNLTEQGGAADTAGKVSLKDFDVLRMIGRGSFGKVLLVRKTQTSQLFALKILNKSAIVQKRQVEHTRTERRVLASITHPFVVCLHYAFQTADKLFFVLDYCPGGDLFFHLSRCGCFPEPMAKFYAAEIVLALIHLHEQGIVYRDLKPENIMLDVDGHVKLADFGLAKEGVTSELNGAYTMCGTPEYLPPEILNRNGHGTAVDWWNLGMVLYEMLTGRPPWYTEDRQELFVRLREAELEFPDGLSVEAQELIRGLLARDPAKRLGAMDVREITYHPFFADIDWNLVYQRQEQPLYKPCQYTDPIDAANFEEEYTKVPLAELGNDGLSIATDAARRENEEGGSAPRSPVEPLEMASSRNENGGRHSDLRNMSYTFAGFTYEGGTFMPSVLEDTAVASNLTPDSGSYLNGYQ